MFNFSLLSRRHLLALFAAAPFTAQARKKAPPVGLELYSVRDELAKDLPATLDAVGKMGYECVEFYASYVEWTPDYAKQIRKQLDGLGMRCHSTHNGLKALTDGLDKAAELNSILGARYLVLAHPGSVSSVDDWKRVAQRLNEAAARLKSSKLHAGYHNHDAEWKAVDGQKPMDILAAETEKDIALQLDVGTCLEAGSDPVAWIEKNPGRIRSLHLKDWSSENGYQVLFGEGSAPWPKIFAAAEAAGGVEYYLIEQEGSRYPELETADRCLVAFQNIHH